jgi:prepilin-type N-terminal cleavage/methylation domain-containing protein
MQRLAVAWNHKPLPALLLVHGTAPAIEPDQRIRAGTARFRAEENIVPRRDGFTLVETLIVVVLLGLIVLIGFPKMIAALGRSELRGARTTMINMVAAARAASVQGNRLTWIKFEGNKSLVLARPRAIAAGGAALSPADTVGVVQDLAKQYGVALTFTAGADSIRFDPRGFGSWTAGDVSVVLSRSGHSSTITIDGLGRVRH